MKFAPLLSLTAADWRRMFESGSLALFNCLRHCGRLLADQGCGRIVSLGSIAETVPSSGNALHGSSTAAARRIGLPSGGIAALVAWLLDRPLDARYDHVSLYLSGGVL